MAPPEQTTIVFVPGAWHLPGYWEPTGDLVKKAGYNVSYVSLASVGATKPLQDYWPDVEQIRNHITTAVDADQDVVVVSHSYGGVPSQDAIKGLDKKSRAAEGKQGGVTHDVFCCAFLIEEGVSLLEAIGGKPAPWVEMSEDGMESTPQDPHKVFYNDLTEDQITTARAQYLKPFSAKCFLTKMQYAAWKHVPSTYLYCTEDQAIPIAIQKMMVEQTAANAGVTVNTVTLNASHSPMVSVPEETAMAIRRAAGEKV